MSKGGFCRLVLYAALLLVLLRASGVSRLFSWGWGEMGAFFSCRDYSVVSGLTLCSTFFERLIEARIGCHFDRKFRDLGSD
jgi:hypothetical protein